MEKMFFINPELIIHEGSYEKLRAFVEDYNFSKVKLCSEIDIQDDTVIICPSSCLRPLHSTEVKLAYENIRYKLDEGYIFTGEKGLRKLLNLPD